MKLTFGKYRGRDVCEVPTRYLEWLADQVHHYESPYGAFTNAAIGELHRRSVAWPAPPRPVPPALLTPEDFARLEEFVEAGARILARRHSADFGGTPADLAAFHARLQAVRALLERWREYHRARVAYEAQQRLRDEPGAV